MNRGYADISKLPLGGRFILFSLKDKGEKSLSYKCVAGNCECRVCVCVLEWRRVGRTEWLPKSNVDLATVIYQALMCATDMVDFAESARTRQPDSSPSLRL